MFILFYDTTVSCFRWRRGKGVESNLFCLFGQLVLVFPFFLFRLLPYMTRNIKKESGTQRGDARMEREKRDRLIDCLLALQTKLLFFFFCEYWRCCFTYLAFLFILLPTMLCMSVCYVANGSSSYIPFYYVLFASYSLRYIDP